MARSLPLAAALAALAALPAAHAAVGAPRLGATPTAARPGASLELTGRGFPASAHLVLLVRRPHGRTVRMGSAVTGSRGGFVATIRIRSRAAAGTFDAIACQDACRVQVSVRFRIVSG